MKAKEFCKGICNRQDNKQLPCRRYDKTVDTISESLEYGTCNNTETCKNKAKRNDAKSRNTDFQHGVGSIEKCTKQELWRNLEDDKSGTHDAYSDDNAEFYRLGDSLFISGSIIICDDWNHTIIQSEYRHKDKALQFEIYAKHSGCCRREHKKNLVHSESHNRADCLHDDGRQTYLINDSYCSRAWTEMAHTDIDFLILCMIKEERKDNCYKLSGYSCKCGTCNFEPRESKETKDHDRIQDDIDNGTGSLRDHIINCLSGRLQKTFKCNLQKDSDRAYGNDCHILCSIF